MVFTLSCNNGYVTLEKLVAAVQAHAPEESYAIVQCRSKKTLMMVY